jgi:hypothetical protein
VIELGKIKIPWDDISCIKIMGDGGIVTTTKGNKYNVKMIFTMLWDIWLIGRKMEISLEKVKRGILRKDGVVKKCPKNESHIYYDKSYKYCPIDGVKLKKKRLK